MTGRTADPQVNLPTLAQWTEPSKRVTGIRFRAPVYFLPRTHFVGFWRRHASERAVAHDLVIKNAIVVDGLGNPATEGEIAVSGGRISEVGQRVGEGRETVDAEGLTLAPGIIDLHTHFDAQLTWDPYATPSNRLG